MDHEQKLDEIVTAYLRAVEAGQDADPSAWLARYPELAEELAEFFAGQNSVDRVAAPLRAHFAGLSHATPDLVNTLPTDDPSAVILSPHLVRNFGDYELLEEIASGGMGMVCRARQVSLNRQVALKMIVKGELATPADVQRFHAEAEAAAGLDHPNIVPIYEVGEYEGRQYYAMKLIEGGNLARHIDEYRDRPRAAAALVASVARAVHHAHQRGILHRDLKPANILLASNVETPARPGAVEAGSMRPDEMVPMVSDFGLAKRLQTDVRLSQSGAIIGTPSYMAPEQASGEKGLTTAADIWALGAILYELLTGRPPFKGDAVVDTLFQVIEKEPDAPSRIRPDIDRDLETICMKCLHKEPGQRYATAAALAEDLQRFLSGQPILARPVGTLERGLKWVRRRPTITALLAVSFGAAVTLTGVILDSNFRLQHERDHARNLEEKANDERNQALKAKDDANRQRLKVSETLSHTGAERGRRFLESGNGLGLLDLLEARRAADELPALRDAQTILWSGWESASAGRLEQVLPSRSPVTALVFAPDGKTLATRVKDGSLILWDVGSGTVRATISPPAEWVVPVELLGVTPLQQSLAFSTDGTALVSRWSNNADHVGRMQAWDAVSGRPLCPPIKLDGPEKKCLSPDGRRLAVSTGATLQIRDAKTDLPVGPSWNAAGNVTTLLFNPDGTLLVTLGGGLLEWWDAATGKQHVPPTPTRERKDPTSVTPSTLAFSPNGKWLICCLTPFFEERDIQVYDVATGKPVGKPLLTQTGDGDTKISPDGATLAVLVPALTGFREGRVQLWRTAGAELFGEPSGHEGEAICLDISPDGRLLATGGRDGTARLWNLATGKPYGQVLWHVNQIAEVVFSPDSRHLATLDETGTVRLWNTAERPANGVPVYHTPASAYVLDPTGKWVMIFRELDMERLDLATFQPIVKSIQFEAPFGSIACSPDGLLLAISGEKGIQFWDIAAGKPRGQPIECPHKSTLTFTPDGKWLIAMGGSGEVRMWDTVTGKVHDPPFRGGEKQAAFFDLQISADGKLVATRCTFGLFLWNADQGKELPFNEHRLSVAMSRAGNVLASGDRDGSGLTVLEPLTGRTVARLPEARYSMIPPEFSPDGRLVAVPNEDQTVVLWDLVTGKQYGPRLVNRQPIQRVLFSPDGRLLVTVSPVGTLRLWDVASGQQLGPHWEAADGRRPLEITADYPTQVEFTPDGRRLAALGADLRFRLWQMPSASVPFREMELRTWSSLGVRSDGQGGWQAIPGPDWQALRQELRTLEASR
jgi:WD40 repeat protein/serine/threonine protein kinase